MVSEVLTFRLRMLKAGASSTSRWMASGLHLLISVGIAFAVLLAMLILWYPQPYFEAMGGKDLLFILVGVDVMVGPLITLIIFDVKKKSLKFDLAVIAVLQLGALAYGVYAVFEARPVYVVFAKDRFDVVTAKDVIVEESAKVERAEFKSLPIFGPKTIAARLPADPIERERILFAALSGMDIQSFPQHYVPYNEEVEAALKAGKPLLELMERRADSKGVIEKAVASSGRKIGDLLFVPVRAKKKDFSALIDAKTGAVVDFVRIDPWH
jgi:hypothetical protein